MTYICTFKAKEETDTFPRAPGTCIWAVWFPDPQTPAAGRSGLVLWLGSAHSEMSGHFKTVLHPKAEQTCCNCDYWPGFCCLSLLILAPSTLDTTDMLSRWVSSPKARNGT